MGKYRRLSHAIYQCTYHVVWVPKYRYRVLVGGLAELVNRDIRTLCEWKDVDVLELSVQADHVHAVLSIPPKVSVSSFMGFLKGKLAIKVMKTYPRLRKKPYWGNHFWARGYFVSTVGLNEDLIRRYVRYQEEHERREETERRDYDLFQSPPST
jgi:putative transposase